MRILFITQYFFPENFRINDLVFSLKERGHFIEVLSGKPNYPKGKYFDGYSWRGPNEENIQGIKTYRSNLILRRNASGVNLFLNYISFVIFASFKLFKINGKFDKVFVYAPSPITVGFLGILGGKKFKCQSFLWVHDLWPESVKVAGGIKNKFILGLINIMTKMIYKHTDKILIQSPSFKDYIKKQDVKENKLIYYPYYAENFYKIVKPKKFYIEKFPLGFNILFAGNIGQAQSFDTLINAVELLKLDNVNFIILGGGRDKPRIERLIKEKRLSDSFYFFGSFPPEKMPEFFACADALLITLKKADIFSFTIPSKLQSYLACGRPIIGSIDGIANKIIQESNAGLVGPAEDYHLLAKNISVMISMSKKELDLYGKNARKYFEKNFEKESLLEKLEVIFKS